MRGRHWWVLLAGALAFPDRVSALSVQEAILRAKPGVALVTAQVGGEVTLNCGSGPLTVRPVPFVETGTGWFVDGRGYLLTNAHVVDPAHRLPLWVTHELKKKAIDQGCVEPALRARGLAQGQRPDIEEQIRRAASDRGLPTAQVAAAPEITVLLSNGTKLRAEVRKFSPPVLLDGNGQPLPESGRDLALLRVPDGTYPALAVASRDVNIGDPVHILGFPGVLLSHELLNRSATLEASVTSGAVSGFKQDVIGQDIIQTDAPAAHGNSGGPAITDDSTVLGVMTFVSLSPVGGAIVQGFNFLIPAKDVLKFLQSTDVVKTGDSRFNPVWAAGLEALFHERYSTAAAQLAQANRLVPDLPDVKKQLATAEDKVKHPPPRPFPWVWATVGVTLVSLGFYGTLGARRWWRERFRITPAHVIDAMENGLQPVLLDARSKDDFETSPLTLPGALRLDPADVEAGRIELQADRAQMIVVYCTSPGEETSARVCHRLRERGYSNARILKGGLGGWTNARLPVEAKSHLPSIGIEIYRNLTLGDVERRKFAAQAIIFREGEDAHGEAYVIHAGTVEVRKRIDGAERVLNTLGEGELLGELALFRKATRSADAVAVGDVELLVIRSERLEWFIRNRPQLTLEILKRLSEQVVATDRDRGEAQLR